jgi:hypothetical protein
MAAIRTEERLTALENEVARLRTMVEGDCLGTRGKTRPDFLDTMTGIHADSPQFEELVRSLEDEREREREEARRIALENEAAE